MTLPTLEDGHPFRGDDEAYGSDRRCHDCGWSWLLHEYRDIRTALTAHRADLRRSRRYALVIIAISAASIIVSIATTIHLT